jgi:hypothetical protein
VAVAHALLIGGPCARRNREHQPSKFDPDVLPRRQ